MRERRGRDGETRESGERERRAGGEEGGGEGVSGHEEVVGTEGAETRERDNHLSEYVCECVCE